MHRKIYIGISGWRYKSWKGVFYPEKLPAKEELSYAGSKFSSVEINGSFYSFQTPKSYCHWRESVPPSFLFAVKGSRFITHMKKLKDVKESLANFFGSGVLCLNEKLGPILWQLPPQLPFMPARMNEFFAMLPKDARSAAAFARRFHNDKLKHSSFDATVNTPIRYALEARHPSFLCEDAIQMLQEHNIAMVFADTAGKFPYCEDVTADFIYIRLHGAEVLYSSGYTDEALDWWSERIQGWFNGSTPDPEKCILLKNCKQAVSTAYVYFDNDAKVQAPGDALRLRERFKRNQNQQALPVQPDL